MSWKKEITIGGAGSRRRGKVKLPSLNPKRKPVSKWYLEDRLNEFRWKKRYPKEVKKRGGPVEWSKIRRI